MKNLITATVEFYFKGEKITSSIELDLDRYMQSANRLPALYPLLAEAANLDLYSYEYEMMQAETVRYSNARGMVEQFVVDGILDTTAFEQAWQDYRITETLQQIAGHYLDIEDINQHPDLKQTLLAAYRAGEASAK